MFRNYGRIPASWRPQIIFSSCSGTGYITIVRLIQLFLGCLHLWQNKNNRYINCLRSSSRGCSLLSTVEPACCVDTLETSWNWARSGLVAASLVLAPPADWGGSAWEGYSLAFVGICLPSTSSLNYRSAKLDRMWREQKNAWWSISPFSCCFFFSLISIMAHSSMKLVHMFLKANEI